MTSGYKVLVVIEGSGTLLLMLIDRVALASVIINDQNTKYIKQ